MGGTTLLFRNISSTDEVRLMLRMHGRLWTVGPVYDFPHPQTPAIVAFHDDSVGDDDWEHLRHRPEGLTHYGAMPT